MTSPDHADTRRHPARADPGFDTGGKVGTAQRMEDAHIRSRIDPSGRACKLYGDEPICRHLKDGAGLQVRC